MPRKGPVSKRELLPDYRYSDVVVAKLVNKLTEDGKKSKAETILFKAIDLAGERLKTEPIKALRKAIDNVKPLLETKSRRVGGATYQVPVEVRYDRQMSLALRWLVSYSRQRGEKGMVEKLAGEIVDAYNGRGGAVKKREDVHKMAEANKAFAHYRW